MLGIIGVIAMIIALAVLLDGLDKRITRLEQLTHQWHADSGGLIRERKPDGKPPQ